MRGRLFLMLTCLLAVAFIGCGGQSETTKKESPVKATSTPEEAAVEKEVEKPAEPKAEQPSEKPAVPVEAKVEKPAATPVDKPAPPAEKMADKPAIPVEAKVEKPAATPVEKPAEKAAAAAKEAVEKITEPVQKMAEKIAPPAEKAVEKMAAPAEKIAETMAVPVEKMAEKIAAPVEKMVEKAAAPAEKPATPVEKMAEEIAAPAEKPAVEAAAVVEKMAEEAAPKVGKIADKLAIPGAKPAAPAEKPAKKKKAKAAAKEQKALTLAVIPKSTGGEFWETVELGAMAAALDMNVDVKWDGTLTETEIAEQNKIIENMINLGVDGMALAPLNQRAMKKKVQAAVDAGIPVVVFDSAVDGDAHVSFVATDNIQGGAMGGKHMLELLGEKKGKVMVLRFVQGTGSTEARAKGFIDTVTAAGLTLAADPYPEDGTVAGAKKTASNTLEGFIVDNKLEIDGIFACNLYTALGMAAALDDLRKSGIEVNAKFIGFDTSDKLISGLMDGSIDALVAQDPQKMGYLAVETLVKHLRGKKVGKMVDTGVELVTKARLDNDEKIRKLVGME